MKLVEILNKADQAYSYGFLSEYYDEKTGEKKNGSGDSLAKFIACEIIETYVADSSDHDQVAEARRVILNALTSLQSVYDALGELR